MKYRYNPSCGCPRCRAHGFMGPAILITIGVLFLLDQMTHIYWLEFHRTCPALLIVIGLVLFMQHSTPASGHIPREYMVPPPGQPPYVPPPQQQWRPPVAPASTPPASAAGTTHEGEVHNG